MEKAIGHIPNVPHQKQVHKNGVCDSKTAQTAIISLKHYELTKQMQ